VKEALRTLPPSKLRVIYLGLVILLLLIIATGTTAAAVWVGDIRDQLLVETIVAADENTAPLNGDDLSVSIGAVNRALWTAAGLGTIGYSIGMVFTYLALRAAQVPGDWGPRIGVRLAHLCLVSFIIVDVLSRTGEPVHWAKALLAWAAVLLELPALRLVRKYDRRLLENPSSGPG